MGEIVYSAEKLRELIVYSAEKSRDDPTFGSVKLNKILYYADFYAYRTLGAPISGAEYQRLPEGPAPRWLLTDRHDLLADGSIEIEHRQVFNHVQQRVVPKRPVRPGVLSEREIALVDEVIAALRFMNARQVSDMSHEELGWRLVGDRETIPYRTAFLSAEPLTQHQIERGLEVARRHELVGG